MKFFNNLVNTRRNGNRNGDSSVVVETMKIPAKGCYCYLILAASRPTVKKYLVVEKKHDALHHKILKQLTYTSVQFFEVQLIKSEIENEEPVNVNVFVLQLHKRESRSFIRNSNNIFALL